MATTDIHGVDPLAVRANKLDLVERLADDLAHEIKNPLHSMVINLEVLKRRIARSEDSGAGELLRYAGILGTELDRVSRRIDLLLRMVRPDRGGEPVTLGETVEEMLELLEVERGRLGVAMEYHPGAPLVRGHLPREAARQLVLNLLLASLDVTPSGGTVGVYTETHPDAERIRVQLALPLEGAEPGEPTRLAVARTLCTGLGGQILVEVGDAGLNGAGRESTWLLSLPIGVPSGTGSRGAERTPHIDPSNG